MCTTSRFVLAPVIFIALRLLQGLALGGQYGGAATYIAEHAPEGRRGFYTSWLQTTATLGLFLKVVTFPITLLSLGVFWFVINALMLKLVSVFVPGFTIQGFLPAFFGALVLSLVNLFLKILASRLKKREL